VTQPIGARPTRGLARQFGKPTGVLGRLVGGIMARKNVAMNRFAVEALDAQPTDEVLEIGFGPGLTIADLAKCAGRVVGIELSEVMVRQANRRNRAAVDAGRVELLQGSVLELPFEDGRFDRALDVNCFHHWPDQPRGLAELRRTLQADGTLLLCLRGRHPTRKFMVAPGYTDEELDRVRDLVTAAGFRDLSSTRRTIGSRVITCLTATR
jgi:ubiquinone/menaquinone biosynthesis C-methylase UbiE